jgi:hypothetical protein
MGDRLYKSAINHAISFIRVCDLWFKQGKYRLLFLIVLMLGSHVSMAIPPDWSVNPADYEFNMTGIIRVMKANNVFLNEGTTMIGVFVEGETRGVVNSDDILYVGDDAYFPVTMYSNEQEGDSMDFKVYVGSLDSVFTAFETAIFNRVLTLGTPADPFILNIGMCDDILVLGTEFSPISGLYRAGLEIRLEGNIDMTMGTSLTLDAPIVKSQNMLNLDDNATLIIQGTGCN